MIKYIVIWLTNNAAKVYSQEFSFTHLVLVTSHNSSSEIVKFPSFLFVSIFKPAPSTGMEKATLFVYEQQLRSPFIGLSHALNSKPFPSVKQGPHALKHIILFGISF